MEFGEMLDRKLNELEEKENIRILHCVESGSRAWGFPSPDSDYDVRFIYARPREFYLRLDKTRDVIEWELDKTWDINGWDIQKTLRLLHKSNPTIFEWNCSPIIYRTSEEWLRVRDIINGYFCSRAGLYHYVSTAKGNYREYLKGDEVKLKKYFYVLRPILACRWIMDKNTPPPMLFAELVEAELEDNMKDTVEGLLRLKMSTPELGTGKRIDRINEYIDRQLEAIDEQLKNMPCEKNNGWDELNGLFMRIITEVWQ